MHCYQRMNDKTIPRNVLTTVTANILCECYCMYNILYIVIMLTGVCYCVCFVCNNL